MKSPILDSRTSQNIYAKALELAISSIAESIQKQKYQKKSQIEDFFQWKKILNIAKQQTTELLSSENAENKKNTEVNISHEPSLVIFQLFARLTEFLLQKLNQVPPKYEIAFFDFMGMSLRPAKAARVPLTFTLVESEENISATIPAYTKIGCENIPELTFETEDQLTVCKPIFQALYFLDPTTDKYSDYSQIFVAKTSEKSEKTLAIFQANDPCPHDVYLVLGTFKELGMAKIEVKKDNEILETLTSATIQKKCLLLPFIQQPESEIGEKILGICIGKKFSTIKKDWIIPFQEKSEILLPTIGTVQNLWEETFNDKKIQVLVSDISPDAVILNDSPLEFAKGFYLFGDTQGDEKNRLYIGSFYFSKHRVKFDVKIAIESLNDIFLELPSLVTPFAPIDTLKAIFANNNFDLEYWNGKEWKNYETLKINLNIKEKFLLFSFSDPNIPCSLEISGIQNWWIRISYPKLNNVAIQELISKNVDKNIANINNQTDTERKKNLIANLIHETIYQSITLRKCFITNISISYTAPIQAAYSYNNFEYSELKSGDIIYKKNNLAKHSLYLGYNGEIQGKMLHIYWAVGDTQDTQKTVDATLTWEYYRGKKDTEKEGQWEPILGVIKNDTNFFRNGDIVSFIVPSDIGKKEEFGKNLYWFRIQISGTNFESFRLKNIFPNTVWASNSISIVDEILGSSNGELNQQFYFSHKPLLSGVVVEVRESKQPFRQEEIDLRKIHGENWLRKVIHPQTGNVEEIWVRWQNVDTFATSQPTSRHYTLDYYNGTITFGNGQQGMIPPAGANNILAVKYSCGGGSHGNIPNDSINLMTTAIANIEKVTNPASSFGGHDQENIETLQERAPYIIKNQEHAISKEDFEWLTKQASQEVLHTYCYMESDQPNNDINYIKIAVLPKSKEQQPKVSSELEDTILTYLKQRCLVTLQNRIKIVTPKYQNISLDITVKCNEDQEKYKIQTKQRIENKMREFFHVTQGGEAHQGWKFQSTITISQLQDIVSKIPGVKFVREVKLSVGNQQKDGYTFQNEQMPFLMGIHVK